MLGQTEAIPTPSAPIPLTATGALDADDVRRIRDDFAVVSADPDRLAALFYGRLFAIDPSLRPMFRSDLVAQGRKLTAALTLVVRNLDRLDELLPAVEALGSRHVRYGVESHHYATVGQALIDTLRTGLGASFDEDAAQAWTAAYGVLASAMIGAGERTRPAT